MRIAALLAFLFASVPAAPATAQAIVSSAAPDQIGITVYRDPNRGKGDALDPDDEYDPLGGYALVTETRVVDLPPGRVTLRFEGVASGIQPETAILTGADPREKNQDRLLLSERGLVDAFTGQRVIVRRTDAATGKVTEERARIRSSHDGLILETARGFETVQCTGLRQTVLYPGVPAGLSAKPVLSMVLEAGEGGRRTLQLSYLAADFDWQANYVAHLSADTRTLHLFAWLTLASRDDTMFPDAQAAAIAGKVRRVEREGDNDDDDDEDWYATACWPQGTTGSPAYPGPPPAEALARVAGVMIRSDDVGYFGGADSEDIIVTGSRIARQEDLGDLKLYRIPFPVTVASNGQKQVALLSAKGVRGELVYRTRISQDEDAVEWLVRFRNLKRDGLGLPLPMGQVAMFQQGFGRPMLLGESAIDDKAVGEDVEFVFANAANVTVETDYLGEKGKSELHRIEVSNANPFSIRYEAEFEDRAYERYGHFDRRTLRRNGKTVWSVEVPAEGKARLDFRSTEIDGESDDGESEVSE